MYKVQVILQNLQSKDENQQFSAALEMCQVSPYFPDHDAVNSSDSGILNTTTIIVNLWGSEYCFRSGGIIKDLIMIRIISSDSFTS